MSPPLEQLWQLVRSIPEGSCATYGDLGQALNPRASGYFVGRWMAQCPPNVPWWRVVAKTGKLPVWKKDPALEDEQKERLKAEGVPFCGETVDLRTCLWLP